MQQYIFWDFDGTLGCRMDGLHGKAWSASMMEAIQELKPGHTTFTHEMIEPFLRSGFPWHEPEVGHPHLNDPEQWWKHIRRIFKRIYMELGFSEPQSEALSEVAQSRYVDLSMWELYDDTINVLQHLQQQGCSHIIVSNHVPELSRIVEHLGLKPFIQHIVNSAEVGYEKPNPKIFEIALSLIGHDAGDVWMIGDNVIADVQGAENAGLNAALVRTQDSRAKHQFDDLYGVMRFLTR